MRRMIESDELSGFEGMLGKKVCLFCGVYIYTGVLSGVDEDHLELTSPKIVYETGSLINDCWTDAQPLPDPWYVMRQGIESWGLAKC